jgi:prepilin-type N-terminal cleavage/methylation domain-containing protein
MTVFVSWWRRSRARRDDDGFSLAEMLSTLVIMGVLTTIVSTMFITSMKATQSNAGRLDQQNSGRTAMEAMTRVIRTAVLPNSLAACSCGYAVAFLAGTPTSMSFYADVDNSGNTVGPSQVTLSVNTATGDLVQITQPPDAGSGLSAGGYTWTPCTYRAVGCSKRGKLLAKGVAAPATAPYLFTYYLHGDLTPYGTVNATDLGNVDAVDILMKIKLTSSAKAASSTFVQRVSLPNVDTVIEATDTASP